MLVKVTDQLSARSPSSPVSLTANTAKALYTPAAYVTDGPSTGATIPPSAEDNAIIVSADSGNSDVVYVLLGSGTVSSTNWHIALEAGQLWDGKIGDTIWRGAVSAISAASAKVGVTVV